MLESVDRDNLLTAGTFIYEPILDEMTFNIVIRWESHEIIQEFEPESRLTIKANLGWYCKAVL